MGFFCKIFIIKLKLFDDFSASTWHITGMIFTDLFNSSFSVKLEELELVKFSGIRDSLTWEQGQIKSPP